MSIETPEHEETINSAISELQNFASIPIQREELENSIDNPSEMKKMELNKAIFMFYAKRLRANPKEHWQYDADKIEDGLWKPMKKLLTALRVQELKNVNIIRRKGKYDIKELRDSYYGKKILEDLPELGNRWVLSKDEYKKIQLQCKKLNLELPTEIEPTTTEQFFEESI